VVPPDRCSYPYFQLQLHLQSHRCGYPQLPQREPINRQMCQNCCTFRM
jgi:hypothetical protein